MPQISPTLLSQSLLSCCSTLPSGRMACNECGYISTSFPSADRHQKEAHQKENLPEEFRSPKQRRIPNKEILEIIQFLDNYNENSKPGAKGVSNFQLDLNNNIGRAVHPQRGLPLYEPVKSNPEVAKNENSGSVLSPNGRKFRSTIEAAKFLENFYENKDPKIFKKKENLPEEFQSPKQKRISNKETLKIVRLRDEDTNIIGQHPTDLPSLRGSNNTPPNNAVFTNQFRSLFPKLTITDPEEAKWLAQTASIGINPTSIITTSDCCFVATIKLTRVKPGKWARENLGCSH